MATIKEIAERAGVSRGTVDRVLNNRGAVCAETEERIRAIIKELDYKPNKAGMALAAQKKKYLIGIILIIQLFNLQTFFVLLSQKTHHLPEML